MTPIIFASLAVQIPKEDVAKNQSGTPSIIFIGRENINDDIKTEQGWTCKHIHTAHSILQANFYLRLGADINGCATKHCPEQNLLVTNITPLHTACTKNNPKLIEFLLKRGAKPNTKDTEGMTPLFWSIKTGNPLIIQSLISYGADPTNPDNYGNNALHCAAGFGSYHIVEYMLKYLSPNSINLQGDTPLHFAASRANNLAVIELLISKGAKVNIENKEKQKPIVYAADSETKEFLEKINPE